MSPVEVSRCSLWQFDVAVAGWVATNTPAGEQGGELSEEQADVLWEMIRDG